MRPKNNNNKLLNNNRLQKLSRKLQSQHPKFNKIIKHKINRLRLTIHLPIEE